MSVNVEIGVCNKAEILVFLSVEVECDAICSDESWVLAHCSWFVAVCILMKIESLVKMLKQLIQRMLKLTGLFN